MDIENIFRYVGIILAILASLYVLYSGQRKLGVLFLLGFILQFQSWLYIDLIGYPVEMGSCWGAKEDYYSCLPFAAKLSTHLAQFGLYVIAFSVVLVGRQSKIAITNREF